MTAHKLIVALLVAFIAFPAVAGPQTEALETCLTDNTSGKERKELVRWILLAMAAHPDMQELSSVTTATRQQAAQAVGSLFTRLLSETCARETRAAVEKEGSESLGVAFSFLGKLAMQELMANKNVTASMSEVTQYLDRKKLEAAFTIK